MLGATISQCSDCGHIQYHNNSCRNCNCPNCQAVKEELWGDKRRAEVIDSPYFHVLPQQDFRKSDSTISLTTAFNCPEADTLLMNYTRKSPKSQQKY
ncbi:MAG: transposase zinc-binding domain-containing protein [Lachnospiraceae bacterium]|nr:transposase zinc-binding domain-containing protein [Lachnospiraceae bacterium]